MDCVNEHCNLHKLLPDYQLAYRNGYSCETAIIKLVNDILWAMENQQVTAVIALDMSAAFNTVDHEIILSVLKHIFGLEDTVLNWFDSCLHPRSCKVSTGKEYSLEQNQVSIKNVEQGQYLSDHLSIVAHLSVDKPPLKKECNYRKINKIDLDDMSHHLEEAFESFENDDLDLMVSEYDRILSSVLNELAPMKEKTITLRPTNPWFMEDIKTAEMSYEKPRAGLEKIQATI